MPGYTRYLREAAAEARAKGIEARELAARVREHGGPGAEAAARELERKAERLEAKAVEGLALADKVDAALTGGVNTRNVHGMEADHRVAISAGRSKDPLAKAAQEAGLSMAALAAKAGVSKALLSMARRGERSIRREVADKIEALTGFVANRKNWPKLSD